MDITIIGAGNVGTNLIKAFVSAGFNIVQIISRKSNFAGELAKSVGAEYEISIKNLKKADVYFICTPDDVIRQVADNEIFSEKLIVHTSGTVSMSVLAKRTSKYGVFYPLQSLKKSEDTNFKRVPIFIEAIDKKILAVLEFIAKRIADNVYELSSEKRLKLHIAAVFANNFTNHMITIAEQFIEKNNIPVEVLAPLLQKTSEKIKNGGTKEHQTGPACRGDKETINAHLKILSNEKSLMKNIYAIMSESLFEMYK